MLENAGNESFASSTSFHQFRNPAQSLCSRYRRVLVDSRDISSHWPPYQHVVGPASLNAEQCSWCGGGRHCALCLRRHFKHSSWPLCGGYCRLFIGRGGGHWSALWPIGICFHGHAICALQMISLYACCQVIFVCRCQAVHLCNKFLGARLHTSFETMPMEQCLSL